MHTWFMKIVAYLWACYRRFPAPEGAVAHQVDVEKTPVFDHHQ